MIKREREREIMALCRSGLMALVNAGRAGGSTSPCPSGMDRSHKVGPGGLTQHSLVLSRSKGRVHKVSARVR
jgi:hypothetical protein